MISVTENSGVNRDAHPVALITGAARRVGATTARVLHAAGFDVAIHYHSSGDEARALVHELNAIRPGSTFALRADLARRDVAPRLLAAFRRKRQRLDLLVNNASVFDRTPLASAAIEHWERIQAINLRAPYFIALAALPLLRKSRGSIINIGDIHAERPRADFSIYCASKAGLVAVTRALALELAPEVRVNGVAPGAVLWAESEDAAMQRRTLQKIPLTRRGQPEDIAEAVRYLAGADYVTGHIINVDGGRLLKC